MDAVTRQICLLSLVPKPPRRVSLESLHRQIVALGFDVDLGTVRRDLKRLSRHFPIVCDEARPHGWHWAREAPAFLPRGYDPALAAALLLGAPAVAGALPATLAGLVDRHVEGARRSLDAQAEGGLGGLVRRFRVVAHGGPAHGPAVDEATLEAVGRAVAAGRRLTARYGPAVRAFTLDPLGLVRRGPVLELVARSGRSPEARAFAVHRLHAVRVQEEPADVHGFDLDAWLEGGAPIALVARVRGEAADRLEDAPLAADQVLERPARGDVRVRATVRDTPALRARLLGFGAGLVVEAPAPLARELAATIRAMAAAYGVRASAGAQGRRLPVPADP